jgi:hypothetical protein
MAKKNKQVEQPTSSSTTADASTSAAPPAATSPDVVRVEQAFAVGNYAFVRRAAADGSNPAASAAAQALMPRIVVEPAQVNVGLVGLVVVLTAWALTATTGG